MFRKTFLPVNTSIGQYFDRSIPSTESPESTVRLSSKWRQLSLAFYRGITVGVAPHPHGNPVRRDPVPAHPTQLTVQDLWDNPAAVADFLNLDSWRLWTRREELLGYHNNNPVPAVLPWTWSPLPRFRCGYRGIPAFPITVQTFVSDSLLKQSCLASTSVPKRLPYL